MKSNKNFISKATYLILALTIGTLSCKNETNSIKEAPKLTQNEISTIECNRDKNIGCNLPFNAKETVQWSDEQEKIESTHIILNVSGDRLNYIIPLNNQAQVNEVRFPVLKNFDIKPPYKLSTSKNNLNFEGQIFGFENNELIGWFNGDEFNLVKPCSFSWNKDEKGIEIVDIYNNVVLSIEQSKFGDYKFKGYFKIEDSFYIIDEETTVTKDLELAKKRIKMINKIFDHIGANSLGKRI